MKDHFEKNRHQLQQKLQSAARFGTSAFRLGLIPQGISDHLPINVEIGKQYRLISWNLLADEHLYNNFRNMSGMQILIDALLLKLPTGCLYYSSTEHGVLNNLFHFFAELSQFLYQKLDRGAIRINKKILEAFVSGVEQPSRLARSRDENKAKLLKEQVKSSRKAIIDLLLDSSHKDVHEFKLAIRQSLELIYHIKHYQGHLRWENRVAMLYENEELIKHVLSADFLTLQECTDPEDIADIYRNHGKDYHVISHRLSEGSNDQCAILFDKKKFRMVDEPLRIALDNSKPCIFIKLKDIKTQNVFILASIHHPGTPSDKRQELVDHMNTLRQGEHENIPFYIAGDFNHDEKFFENFTLNSNAKMFYPNTPSMSGSDFGNLNQAIDAVISNCQSKDLEVKTIHPMPVSSVPRHATVVDSQDQTALLATKPAVIVHFETNGRPEPFAMPRFTRSVHHDKLQKENIHPLESALRLAKAQLGPRPSLF